MSDVHSRMVCTHRAAYNLLVVDHNVTHCCQVLEFGQQRLGIASCKYVCALAVSNRVSCSLPASQDIARECLVVLACTQQCCTADLP
jgi:hypothetical protein